MIVGGVGELPTRNIADGVDLLVRRTQPFVDHDAARTVSDARSLQVIGRLRDGGEPIDPDPNLGIPEGFLYQLTGSRPDAAAGRAMDAYFVVAAEHSFNASTFTARVIASTQSDLASAVCGAIGALKGPLHGGAPSEVVSQLHEIGSIEFAEQWIDDALDRGERLMGFGHRVYRAEDPRARVLRRTSEQIGSERFEVAVALEQAALAELEARRPDRVLATNVEFWSAVVLDHADVPSTLFTSIFTCARTAGWSAHILEQKREQRLIRPSAKYVGPPERSVSGL